MHPLKALSMQRSPDRSNFWKPGVFLLALSVQLIYSRLLLRRGLTPAAFPVFHMTLSGVGFKMPEYTPASLLVAYSAWPAGSSHAHCKPLPVANSCFSFSLKPYAGWILCFA